MVYSSSGPDDLLAPFWAAAAGCRLLVQRCEACENIHFPPAAFCPECLSAEQEWIEASGRGRLESSVEFHQRYWADVDLPYVVALIRLEEGPLMLSNLVGMSYQTPPGTHVKVVFGPGRDGRTLPMFAADEGSARGSRAA